MSDTAVWPADLFEHLDRQGPVPLHVQLSRRLEEAIRSGELAPGVRLENEVALGERLGLSRPTVRRAIQTVVDQGLLVRRRGIGTIVVPNQVRRSVALTSLFDDLAHSGAEPGTRVLTCTLADASVEVAERLRLDAGAGVVHLRRLRFADAAPIAIMENWLPADLAALDAAELEARGLYDVLRDRGIDIRVADQRIGARNADREERRLLDLSSGGDAVLTMERVSYDGNGRVIEFGHHCYRADRYWFETTLVAR